MEAAERALPAWAKLTAEQRSNTLRKWYELIVANRENLALILTSKQGKPLSEALGELDIGAPMSSCTPKRRAASMAKRFSRRARMQGCLRSRHRLASAAPHAVELPQLDDHPQGRAGARRRCTVVLKPGNQTPLSAVALAALAEKAGVPKSVFNVIAGDSGGSARFCASTRPCALSASPARRRSARSSTVGPASA